MVTWAFLDSVRGRARGRARARGVQEVQTLLERVTTTRTTKDGAVTTTVRERFTAPDWHADGWFLEPRARCPPNVRQDLTAAR